MILADRAMQKHRSTHPSTS